MATLGEDPAARPATILDVAAAAGVSRQTVTRAMNDLPDVSAATRQRVLDAARALNYRPNRAAQQLVRGREVTLGFVVGDLRNPYYPELASEITRRAAAQGWAVLVADVEGPGGAQRVESIAGRVDVVVGHLAPEHQRLVTARAPAVLISDDEVEGVASVRLRYDDAIEAAAAHLAAAGRRRVALLDHAGPGVSGRGRLLRAALERHGLDFAGAAAPRDDDVSGAVQRLLAARQRPDALLCFNDLRAIGALKHLAAAGIAVPGELAVIGIDGLSLGALVTPELTTLKVDTAELAAQALDLAAALLRGEPAAGLRRTVSHTLLLRASA